MHHGHDEALYPISFRKEEAELLGRHLAHRDSVELIGMKRVGISNFLRFFLYHKNVSKTYIHPDQKHMFIMVDLNDLIETEILPFWRLTLKRIVDAVNQQEGMESIKDSVNELFLRSIQIQDLLFTIDTVRDILMQVVRSEYQPTIFFIRFDRLRRVVTPELFSNLQGIVDSSSQKLAYVFTSYRELSQLSPEVFQKQDLATFSHKIYLKPAHASDMEIIMQTLLKKYNFELEPAIKRTLIKNCGGHVQLLQLSLIITNELLKDTGHPPSNFIQKIMEEERVTLQSEELYETLTNVEQNALMKIYQNAELSEEENKEAEYLFNTGYIESNGTQHLFSPFFEAYLENMHRYHKKAKVAVGLTKKEQMLYDVLKAHENEICERDDIIEAVWPECNEIGVSDWALDRLVSRLRSKMKQQDDPGEIQTIKTRGFKMVPRH